MTDHAIKRIAERFPGHVPGPTKETI